MPAVNANLPRAIPTSTSPTATVVAKSHDGGALQAKLCAASNNDSTTTLLPPVSKLSVRDPESGKALRQEGETADLFYAIQGGAITYKVAY